MNNLMDRSIKPKLCVQSKFDLHYLRMLEST